MEGSMLDFLCSGLEVIHILSVYDPLTSTSRTGA